MNSAGSTLARQTASPALWRPAWWWAPLTPLYALGVRLRHTLFDVGVLRVRRAAIPVISVGGLEAGGSGKTPVTAWILAALRQSGQRPGLLSRGYGRKSKGMVVRQPGEPVHAEMLGDEPAMLAQQYPDLPLAVTKDRYVGAGQLRAWGCSHAVLDDGFSHRALHRDLDIVVLRGDAPFGDGHLLPWGTLREPLRRLKSAHVVWVHSKSATAPSEECLRRVQEICPKALLVASSSQAAPAQSIKGETVELAQSVVIAAAGIARPQDFFSSLEGIGAHLVAARSFADHHAFTRQDAEELAAMRRAAKAAWVVITPKDAIKLRACWPDDRLAVQSSTVRVELGKAALLQLLASV